MFQKTCDGPIKVAPLWGKIKNFWGTPNKLIGILDVIHIN
jgi:hypothetical protein